MATVYLAPTDVDSLENLEEVIKRALQKTGAQKEMDLCSYIPGQNGPLSSSTYLKLKDTNKQTLCDLIKKHILDNDLRKIPATSEVTHSEQPYAGKALKECVQEAMKKLNVQNETALCRYIPHGEGYIHHFTYLKMKSANPVQVRNLIQTFILDKRMPQRVPHKTRKRRGRVESGIDNAISMKGKLDRAEPGIDQASSVPMTCCNEREANVPENRQDERIDQILHMMSQLTKAVNHQEVGMVRDTGQLSTASSMNRAGIEEYLQVLQQELIIKIMKKEADQHLWRVFTRLTELHPIL